ncbi:hypothetical protein ACQPUH_06310 [Clostridium perfringens]|uniref:hypothetical protein n=1 Tax=Clostridium TaxID=1485 RepID=UPI00016BD56B|nr:MULTISPECIES: hypothetical protein [Clostridium]EDT27368.1 hypothetical protein AC5_0173 [Clostridium perfringens CPE str. F4969]EGT0681549.1 hypothetical protein [Clostridium perfringens]MBI6004730.1 hypothetical protein [Clostridium perfringens]MBI6017591.1 hypothetical protein [Clostridium perfringens]MDH5070700.1 hypothetical protein [Clostridium perfringens]
MKDEKRTATVTLRCSESTKREFKIACIRSGIKATDIIEEAMLEFIDKVNKGVVMSYE